MKPCRALAIATSAVLISACTPESPAPHQTPTAQRLTSSPTPHRTPDAAPVTATVVMNGDLLWHNTLWFGAREDANRAGRRGPDDLDFLPTLSAIGPMVSSADLAICHNEVPVAQPGGPYRSYPQFSAPPQTLEAVKGLGYDLCTTASNHSLDQGYAGLKNTLDRMDAVGLAHVGTARSQHEAEAPTIITTKGGVRIAVVEGAYGTNGIPLPNGKPWAWTGLAAPVLLQRARAARQRGANIVLVAIHGGDEYSSRPNRQQTDLARVLTASPDVDLVYGHHAHVVQPITTVNGKWVVFGLGNLVAQHRTDVPRGQEGITTRFTFARKPDGRFAVTAASYFPTLVTHYRPGSPARVLLVNQRLAKLSAGPERTRLVEAARRTAAAVRLLGGTDGLREG
ncbi:MULTISPECIES: CapA family protein [unclassified Luteococcus]|uniref:CapA family protein n=1 Tax=unclassified Luteococcus TaxID=2639923 RepID=UPI00313D0722